MNALVGVVNKEESDDKVTKEAEEQETAIGSEHRVVF